MSSQVIPYLVSLGIERTTAGMVGMAIPLVSIPARFIFGWLSDIFPTKYVFTVSIALMGVGLFIFSFVTASDFGILVTSIIVLGLGLGGATPLRPPIVREYFGTRNFGTIFGLQHIFLTVGTVVASPLAGWVYDVRGTYYPIWLILGGVVMFGAFLMLTMPLPSRPPRN